MTSDSPPRSGFSLKSVFIGDDGRLRSGWRVLIHTLLIPVFAFLTGLVFLLIGTALGAVISPEDLSLPVLTVINLVSITLATLVARRFLDRRSFRSLGFALDRLALADLGYGFLLPAVMFAFIYAAHVAAGWLDFQAWAWETASARALLSELLAGLALFIVVGYYEELWLRGYQLQNLIEGIGVGWALVVTSVIFGALHLQNPSSGAAALLGILLAGLFLAFAYLRTGRLWLPIGLHIGWNFFEGPVFGFPVSGLQGFQPLIRHQVAGPELITGGSFGPEAGLILVPALALGTLGVYWHTRGRSTQAGGERAEPEPIPPLGAAPGD